MASKAIAIFSFSPSTTSYTITFSIFSKPKVNILKFDLALVAIALSITMICVWKYADSFAKILTVRIRVENSNFAKAIAKIVRVHDITNLVLGHWQKSR